MLVDFLTALMVALVVVLLSMIWKFPDRDITDMKHNFQDLWDHKSSTRKTGKFPDPIAQNVA